MRNEQAAGFTPLRIAVIILMLAGTPDTKGLDIVFDYDSGVGLDTRDAAEYAAGFWETWITSESSGDANTLEIEFDATSMGSGTLGNAPWSWDGHAGGFALTPAQYMIETGSDLENTDGIININSDTSWYAGTDGSPGGLEYDLVSVVLHELGHHMGITGSYRDLPALGWGWGYYKGTWGPWELTKWDAFLRDQDGDAPAPRGETESFDETGTVTFVGANAVDVLGAPVSIYAPASYNPGSSLTHVQQGNLDPAFDYGRALMAHSIEPGRAIHGLWDYEVAILRDLGWGIVSPARVYAKGYDGLNGEGCSWHDGKSWDFGLPPEATTAVFIEGDENYTVRVDREATAADLTVSGAAKLMLHNGGILEVSGDVINDGVLTVILGSELISNELKIGVDEGGELNLSGGSASCANLNLGYWSGDESTCTLLSGGEITVEGHAYIGLYGRGLFDQSGGRNTLVGSEQNYVYLGVHSGSSGEYRLSGNGQLRARGLLVGREGMGTFEQAGGTVMLDDELVLGNHATGTGEYTLSSGGELMTQYGYIGWKGRGAFDQTGGTNTVGGSLLVGDQQASSGEYNLSGGELFTSNLRVGNEGTGTFEQTGGTNTISGRLLVGYFSDSSGEYKLSGGEVSAPYLKVGCGGTGTFEQTGGTNSISGRLLVGYLSDSLGEYKLSGGEVSAPYLEVGCGGTGTFEQTGGTNIIEGGFEGGLSLIILGWHSGSSGKYILSGNGQLSAGRLCVGNEGDGEFIQKGGTNTIEGSLELGAASSGSGIYRLEGGSLYADTVVPKRGRFEIESGILNTRSIWGRASGSIVGYGTIDASAHWGHFGSLTAAGGILRVDAPISGNGTVAVQPGATAVFSDGGTLSGSIVNHGTVQVSEGRLGATGSVSGSGTVAVDSGGRLFLGANGSIGGPVQIEGELLTGAEELSLYGPVSGSGRLVAGAGTLNLTNTTSGFDGQIQVLKGVLKFDPGAGESVTCPAAVENLGSLQVSSGTVDLGQTVVKAPANRSIMSFAENFDDAVILKIDEKVILEDMQWNVPSTSGTICLTKGWHDFEVRFGQGSGAIGPVDQHGEDYTGLGLGWDPDGRGKVFRENHEMIPENLFRHGWLPWGLYARRLSNPSEVLIDELPVSFQVWDDWVSDLSLMNGTYDGSYEGQPPGPGHPEGLWADDTTWVFAGKFYAAADDIGPAIQVSDGAEFRLGGFEGMGAVDVNGQLVLAGAASDCAELSVGESGVLDLDGIDLAVTGDFTSDGTVTHSAGNLSVGRQYVGYQGQGHYVQTGGTSTVQEGLHVGTGSGATGVYELQGGSLSCMEVHIGHEGLGELTWSDGTLEADSITVAAGGELVVGITAEHDGALYGGGGALEVSDDVTFEVSGIFGETVEGVTFSKSGEGLLVISGPQDHMPDCVFEILRGTVEMDSDASGTGLMDDADLSILVADATLNFGCNQHLNTLDIRDSGLVQLTGANVVVVRNLVLDGVPLGATTLTPEPATLALLTLGALGLLGCRKSSKAA